MQLSARYVSDRFLPDKAVDLIDEAAAKKRIENPTWPRELTAMQEQRQVLVDDEKAASENGRQRDDR